MSGAVTGGVTPSLCLRGVGRRHDDRWVLADLDLVVEPGQRWVVLGPNGCGKTTLLQIASLYLHPTTGTVEVLGETLGRTDVRRLRRRIGLTSSGLAAQLRPALTAAEVVVTATYGALEPWWHTYTDADHAAARAALDRVGMGWAAAQPLGVLSSGERQRVLLARALLGSPGLLLLDEPTAGLDLGGREELVSTLALLAADPTAPPVLLVTHHVEEIPPGYTHALLLRDGRALTAGPLDATLTSATLSDCFGLPLELSIANGRYHAVTRSADQQAAGSPEPSLGPG